MIVEIEEYTGWDAYKKGYPTTRTSYPVTAFRHNKDTLKLYFHDKLVYVNRRCYFIKEIRFRYDTRF